ncbi:MAG TPA: ABC transporter ATP-binding protein [Rhodospirillaceae bacterium]|nr:ABC transporter ATP-binding protein [Rhodospirillaceae bacterium]
MNAAFRKPDPFPTPPRTEVPAPLLSVEGVTLQYRSGHALVTATHRIDFTAAKGERLVLLGPSGCGKSTLLKAVGGFLRPVEGRIQLDGREIVEPGPDRMMVFQEFDQLLPWKTVRQNILFPLRQARHGWSKADIDEKVRQIIGKVGLTKFAESYPHQLSGGMKQRVAIARAMAMEPAILLMDEPFASLDALTRRRMQDDLLQLWQDTRFTMLFVTHSIDEALLVGSRVIVLTPHPGRVRAVIETAAEALGGPGSPRFRAVHEEISGLLLTERFDQGGGI